MRQPQRTFFDTLTRKPGEFHARCRLATVVKTHLATPEQKEEAKALGLQRHHEGVNARGKNVWSWHFPACDGFETDDREAYQAHLDEFHGGGTKLVVPWTGKIRGPLRLAEAGKPLSKDAAAACRSCPGCGLVAQVDSDAAEAWFADHLDACALAQSGAAS